MINCQSNQKKNVSKLLGNIIIIWKEIASKKSEAIGKINQNENI
jgi:hypothetical protein